MAKQRWRYPNARLLFFARTPRPGITKTRLIPALGREGASQLHHAMMQHVIEDAAIADLAPIELWCDGKGGHPLFTRLRDTFGVELHTQCDGDLGERMHHALSQALSGTHCALLCGTDCPGLDAPMISRCLAALEAGNDAVMVPVEDGGYVAIGLRRPAPRLFYGMQWGHGGVAKETRKRLAGLGLRWLEPARLWDVDEASDLMRLRQAYPHIWQQVSPYFSAGSHAPGGG